MSRSACNLFEDMSSQSAELWSIEKIRAYFCHVRSLAPVLTDAASRCCILSTVEELIIAVNIVLVMIRDVHVTGFLGRVVISHGRKCKHKWASLMS